MTSEGTYREGKFVFSLNKHPGMGGEGYARSAIEEGERSRTDLRSWKDNGAEGKPDLEVSQMKKGEEEFRLL